jgi:hypothetical protein
MPLFIYDDGAVAEQLSAICSGAPISITQTSVARKEFRVTYPAIHSTDKKPNPPIGHTMVYALANCSCRVEIWPIWWDKGLVSYGSGTGLIEEGESAITIFDPFPKPAIISIYYYADVGGDTPTFTVKVRQNLGTGLNLRTECLSPLLMLVHLIAHAYVLITGKHDPSAPEDLALNLENIYRTQHFLSTRVDSHIVRVPVYDLGGCGL